MQPPGVQRPPRVDRLPQRVGENGKGEVAPSAAAVSSLEAVWAVVGPVGDLPPALPLEHVHPHVLQG